MTSISSNVSASSISSLSFSPSKERLARIQAVDNIIAEKYGFEATRNLVNALTNNDKIKNTDPRRGQVVDISV